MASPLTAPQKSDLNLAWEKLMRMAGFQNGLGFLISDQIDGASQTFSAASGEVAIQLNTGAKLSFGPGGGNDYLVSGAGGYLYIGAVTTGGIVGSEIICQSLMRNNTGAPFRFHSYEANNGTAKAFKYTTENVLSTAGAKVVSWENGSNGEIASLTKDGAFVSLSGGGYGLNSSAPLAHGLTSSGSDTYIVTPAGFTAHLLDSGGNRFAKFTVGGMDLSATTTAKIVMAATDSTGTPGAATINKPSGQVAVASGASSVAVSNSLVTASSVVLAVLQDNTDAVQIRSVVPGSNTFTINLTGVTTGARKVGFVVFN